MSNYYSSTANSELYVVCLDEHAGDTPAMLQCVAAGLESSLNRVEQANEASNQTLKSWLLVIAGAMVFFMQAGFAMLCAGCVRKKNVVNSMLKNLLDACGAAVAFYLVGFGLAYGNDSGSEEKSFMGDANFVGMGDIDMGFWFFQYAFSATSVTIVAGTLAERCKMTGYFSYSIFLTGFVYPVIVHAIWSDNGFLSAFAKEPLGGVGVIDFAGSGVIHVTGGMTALLATSILGPRRGRFYDDQGNPLENPVPIKGHSMALQLLGTLVLWFGWYGFNGGSALLLTNAQDTGAVAARAAVNTTLAAACGAATALFTGAFWNGQKGELAFELPLAMNGALGGLVAITAGCGTFEMWSAVVTGSVGGWVYMLSSMLLVRFRIDDAVDAIPVHLFNGAWGVIATGLFSSEDGMLSAFGSDERVGLIYAIARVNFDTILLRNQVYALLFIVGFTFVTMTPFFLLLNYLGWFRADMVEELAGLDFSYHAQALEKSAVRDLQNAQGDESDEDDDEGGEEEDGEDHSDDTPEPDSNDGFPLR
mmetsp:Transcript_16116/g.30672  ORF Transcript_16116/g.30672 Transcript_16116/m.30672 type:complete len:533 (+) Transcript_16116:247-1845(+)